MRGNPHATFDEAGAGNVVWLRCCDTRRRKGEVTGNTNFDLPPTRQSSTLPGRAWGCDSPGLLDFIPKRRRKTLYGELKKHLGEVFHRRAQLKEWTHTDVNLWQIGGRLARANVARFLIEVSGVGGSVLMVAVHF